MSDAKPVYIVHHTTEPARPAIESFIRGHRHRWAWCITTLGAEVQRCYDCGMPR